MSVPATDPERVKAADPDGREGVASTCFGGSISVQEAGVHDAVFVHPQGLCESAYVGDGTRVWAFAHVLDGARVGRDCNVCDGAYIEGGAVVGDRVTVKNQVMISDAIRISRNPGAQNRYRLPSSRHRMIKTTPPSGSAARRSLCSPAPSRSALMRNKSCL